MNRKVLIGLGVTAGVAQVVVGAVMYLAGVYFAPWNEDYGFVTLEAFRSAKAVLTAVDSGGPAELVRHGENGLVAEPTAEAVAGQLDALGRDKGLTERLGQAARRDADAHRWERAVEELLRDV